MSESDLLRWHGFLIVLAGGMKGRGLRSDLGDHLPDVCQVDPEVVACPPGNA